MPCGDPIPDPGHAACRPPTVLRALTRQAPLVSFGLFVAAVAIPPRACALLLAGGATPPGRLVAGVWLFKALLAVHAVAAATWPRWWGAEPAGGEPAGRRAHRPTGAAVLTDPWLAAILAGAAVLRCVELGAGLWFDEIHTLVEYVRRPLGTIVTTSDSLNQHLLYTVAAWACRAILGDGAVSLRLPAVVFGLAGIAAVAWLGRQAAGRREGLLAAALVAASYHHVWFSQNARGYTALLLWTTLATGLLWRSVTGRPEARRTDPLAYAGVMALALLTHLSAAVVLASHCLLWAGHALFAREPAARPRRWPAAFVLAGTLALQGYALGLPQLAGVVGDALAPAVGLAPGGEAPARQAAPEVAPGVAEWQSPMWFVRETLDGLVRGLPGGWLALVAGVVVGAAGLLTLVRREPFLVLAMFLPALATAGVLLAAERNLWPRFFFFVLGFLALVAVQGLFALARRARVPRPARVGTAAALVAVVASAATVPRAWGPKQDWEGARRFLEAHAPAEQVGAVGMAGYVYDVYLATGWRTIDDAGELAAAERAGGGAGPWLVYSFPPRLRAVAPALARRIESGYATVASFTGTLSGGEVIVARPAETTEEVHTMPREER